MDDLFQIKVWASPEEREAFTATMCKMALAWGSIMTKTEPDGTCTIILPPDFVSFDDPLEG